MPRPKKTHPPPAPVLLTFQPPQVDRCHRHCSVSKRYKRSRTRSVPTIP